MGNILGRNSTSEEDLAATLAICQPPGFNQQHAAQWFQDMEAHFESFGIHNDQHKFEMVINELDKETLRKLDEHYSDSSRSGYEQLKRIILTLYGQQK